MMFAESSTNWTTIIVTILVAIIGSSSISAIIIKYHPSKVDKRSSEIIEYKESVDVALAANASELATLRQLSETQENHLKRLIERQNETSAALTEALKREHECNERYAALATVSAEQGQKIAHQAVELNTQALTILAHEKRFELLEQKRLEGTL